jgi:acetolactate synthase-1/2/3 large subunit
MKRTGASLVVYALEQIGVRYTFGIPGVHNTEIYDELDNSDQITPVLVTHEGGAAFMADGLSRTTNQIGTLVIVPAAGLTHAMSGIGEAYLDGIPMLIISGGTRRDSDRHFQLHQVDQGRILDGIIKRYFLIAEHKAIIPTIYEAYETAITGEPGPVFVEVPAEIQLFRGEIDALPPYRAQAQLPPVAPEPIRQIVDMLTNAEKPGIYVGWGAVDAAEATATLAERLVAPVATTLQGLSAFPAHHPLHTGMGFGSAAVPAAHKAFAGCDCLLAVGVRFSELATGSYSLTIPETLIHVDINAEVFDKNYPTALAVQGDAKQVMTCVLEELQRRHWQSPRDASVLAESIRADKQVYRNQWAAKPSEKLVSPGLFFQTLREVVPDDAIMAVDDGKHTFLAAELFPVMRPRHFISPTDFNCMGYGVPAAIGARFGNPDQTVVAVVGDGGFLMTGMELLTAVTYGKGLVVFVFHDGELGQISEFQNLPLNRKTCTVLGDVNIEGVAMAVGAHFLALHNDQEIDGVIREALNVASQGTPALVDVMIDYSKRTMVTKGVVRANLSRFSTAEKVHFIGRAVKRRITD